MIAEDNESLITQVDDVKTDIEEMFTFENMRKEILIGREMKVVVSDLMTEITELKAQIALLIANATSSIQ